MPTSPWVLNLSTTPPDIYNGDATNTLHSAFEPPYPYVFWGVNSTEDDIVHQGQLDYHSPAFSSPFPYVFWGVSATGDDVVHAGAVEIENLGAFINSNLGKVVIPSSVQSIGEYSFSGTTLSVVTISEDCTYYPTSFPANCEVHFYEEVN